MSYLKISELLSNYITKDLDFDEEKKEIISYSLEYIFLQIFGFVVIIILAYFFNAVKPAVIAAIFGAILRKFSGGAHFNSPILCLSFGAVVYTAIGILANSINYSSFWNIKVMLFMVILSLIIVAKLAPVDSPAKPIHSISFKKKLKFFSLIFICIAIIIILYTNSFIIRTSITLGIAYQTLTLLPIFNKKEV